MFKLRHLASTAIVLTCVSYSCSSVAQDKEKMTIAADPAEVQVATRPAPYGGLFISERLINPGPLNEDLRSRGMTSMSGLVHGLGAFVGFEASGVNIFVSYEVAGTWLDASDVDIDVFQAR